MAASLILNASEEHGRECDKMVDDFIAGLQKSNPTSLFHYTDANGFCGIIKNGTIWATDARHLNDPTEAIHGVKLAREFLEQNLRSMKEEEKDFFRPILGLSLENIAQSIAGYFATCFSSKGDDLNQWRSYADGGKGVSLEFSRSSIDEIIAKNQKEPVAQRNQCIPSSFQITYDEEKFLEIFKKIIYKTKQYIVGNSNTPSAKEVMAKNMSRSTLLLSLYFKHNSYKEESEYRVLLTSSKVFNGSGTSFRTRQGSIIPYKELRWKDYTPCLLNKVWIGPAAPHDMTPHSVKEFLMHHGFSDKIDVVKSTIPYRTF